MADAIESKCSNIIVVGGNHDSVVGLNEQKRLLEAQNVFVVGGAVDRIEESIFPISRDREMIGVISAIPYLSETSLRSSRGSTDESDRAKALEREISRYYDRAYSISRDIGYGSSIPLVATGHLSTLMRYMSGATRDIYIGSLELFNREMFPPFDYIALGHYHERIVSDNLAYSGSPIPLSFDEVNYRKYILDVEISDGEVTIDSIEVPKFRDIFRSQGGVIEDIEGCPL